MSLEAVENQNVENAVEQDDAAFAAGFNEARGEEPPVEEPKAEEPKVEEAPAAVEPEPEPTPNLIAGLTEDQIRAAILKANEVDSLKAQIEKSFGKYGELNRSLQQLQQQKSGGVQLNAQALKRLSSEFPEMAEMLASDLSEALAGVSGGGQQQAAFDPDAVEQMLQGRIADVRAGLEQEMEKRLLKRAHRDWEDVVTSDDFKLWRQNVLPAEESERLGGSWDSDFIAEKLTEFKEWKKQATVSRENKQKRLEAAVTPRGDAGGPSTVQSEEEAFLAAFKRARG